MNDDLNRIRAWAFDHESEMAEELGRWIRIPSVRDDSTAAKGQPFGRNCAEMLQYAKRLAERWGFYTENHDGYALTIGADVPMADDFGIIAHMDVVAADDDWSFPPFSGEIRDGFILGRGSTDDKPACIMALFLLRAMRELNISFHRNIRLIFGANEETGMEDLHYYLKHANPPALSLVPDCLFPTNYAQKGTVRGTFSMPVDSDIIAFDAGISTNAVPESAKVCLRGIQNLPTPTNGIRIFAENGNTLVIAKGISTHAANPEKGCSAISMLTKYLLQVDLQSQSRRAIEEIERLTSDYYGTPVGIACEDVHTGHSTLVMGTAHLQNGRILYTMDGRICLAMPSAKAQELLKAYCAAHDIQIEKLFSTPGVYFDPNSKVIRALQDSWHELTGRNDNVYFTGGNTYSRAFPNAITYGIIGGGFGKHADWLLPGRGAAHEKDEVLHMSVLPNALIAYYAAFAKLDIQ